MELPFTFAALRAQFEAVRNEGYTVIRCRDYAESRPDVDRLLVNRVDIDVSPTKARRLGELFVDVGISATFFVRMHAEYNPFGFEAYRCLRWLRDNGFELGYHSEIVDEAFIWNEDSEACLRRDLDVLRTMFDVDVVGVASHGGFTTLNNLDFWDGRDPADFGLLYEAYDRTDRFGLFHRSTYVSDSSWTYWKTYVDGALQPDDRRDIAAHASAGTPAIYSLIHPETYYDRHPYE